MKQCQSGDRKHTFFVLALTFSANFCKFYMYVYKKRREAQQFCLSWKIIWYKMYLPLLTQLQILQDLWVNFIMVPFVSLETSFSWVFFSICSSTHNV